MCRHAAYVGPGVALSELLCDLDHSLLKQSYQPRHLLTGVVCADGYGVGWYDEDGEAARYAFPGPIWSDPNLAAMTPRIRSDCFVAAVRNATVAGSNTHANCAPFTQGRFHGSLNGALDDFAAWRDELWDGLPPALRRAGRGDTDAELVFLMVLAAMEGHEGPSALATATQEVCRDLIDRAQRRGTKVQLNLLLSDGDQVVATRAGSMPTQNSLFLLHDGEEFPDAFVVASEPLYDDPAWQVVEPDTVLVLRADAPPVRLAV